MGVYQKDIPVSFGGAGFGQASALPKGDPGLQSASRKLQITRGRRAEAWLKPAAD